MPSVIYGWKVGSRVSLDAQATGAHLYKLLKSEHQLTAAIVLRDAKKARSPLHDHFEWDDGEAAQQYRLNQARYVLRSVVVLRDNGEKPKPRPSIRPTEPH